MMQRRNNTERGAVSLFIVVLSALLITTVTVAFVRIMVQNQQQAATNDLSKSALDSAYAGVEDAKRALVTFKSSCVPPGTAVGSTECINLEAALRDSTHCDTMQRAGISGSPADKEVLVKQVEGDEILQQAYTCVKVQLDTNEYVGIAKPNVTIMIPLKSKSAIDRIVVEWYSQDDIQKVESNDPNDDGIAKIDLGLDSKLPKLADWPSNRPALMHLQLVQYADKFNLSSFNDEDNGKSNNNSLYLMPSSVGLDTANFLDDARRSQTTNALQQIRCDPTFTSISTGSGYACKATIMLPDPINGDRNNRNAYLRLSEIYNPSTAFSVSMWNGTDNVLYNAVQPIVDSTGRANDLFRRIRSHIELEGSSIPVVESTIDLTGNLCKAFLVTDKPEDYSSGGCVE